jgi:hypothetical protein
MWPKFALLAAVAALATAAFSVPTAGAQTQSVGSTTQEITGTAGFLAYDLIATVDQVESTAGGLAAVGTVTGTVTNTLTGAVTTVNQVLDTPVTAVAMASDGSLAVDLGLGGQNIDALGQSVSLSPIEVGLDSSLISGVLGEILGLLGGLGGLGGGLL